jgi:hypothetical protein
MKATITSLEISKILKKEHTYIVRLITNIVEDLYPNKKNDIIYYETLIEDAIQKINTFPPIRILDGNFILDLKHVLVLLTFFSINDRKAVIDNMIEKEKELEEERKDCLELSNIDIPLTVTSAIYKYLPPIDNRDWIQVIKYYRKSLGYRATRLEGNTSLNKKEIETIVKNFISDSKITFRKYSEDTIANGKILKNYCKGTEVRLSNKLLTVNRFLLFNLEDARKFLGVEISNEQSKI